MAVTEGRTGTTGRVNHYIVPASAATVHWGYFNAAAAEPPGRRAPPAAWQGSVKPSSCRNRAIG
jgi:hypothetical protein